MLLGDMLVEQKLISPAQLHSVLEQQHKTGKKLGRLLVESGAASEEQVGQVMARQFKAPFIDLRSFAVLPELARRLPEAHARHHRVLILEERGPRLLIGFADPSDLLAYDEVTRILKREVDVAVISEAPLLQALDRVYRRSDQISGLVRQLEQDIGEDSLEFGGSSASAEDAPVARLLQSLFEDAMAQNASDIHIEPQDAKLQIRFRVDGILTRQAELDPKVAPALLVRVKLMAGLDISEKRLPQDGRFSFSVREKQVDVRLSTVPIQNGESAVMRLLAQRTGSQRLDRVGMPRQMLDRFRALSRRASGLILVTGPTGSGKTTTLYSALAELNSVDTKIITVEDPVEYRLSGICQVQVNDKIDLTFATVLRAVLRQDPDVILIGEMRDQETAQIGLRAAITGHMVFSTVHTREAASTPIRLIDMGVPPVMVASALQAVVSQRLMRVNCENCSEPYQASAQELAWVEQEIGGPPADVMFKKGRGCQQCADSGFRGRTGIYELLEMNSDLVSLVTRNDPDSFTRLAHQYMQGQTMASHALSIAAEGRTTIAEVMRVASSAGD